MYTHFPIQEVLIPLAFSRKIVAVLLVIRSFTSSQFFSFLSFFKDDEEEVQQPRSTSRLEPTAVHTLATEPVLLQDQPEACKEEEADAGVIMVAVGCKSCMMYIMLPKLHPSCPKCGNSDSLLDFASSLAMPKKQRVQKFNWVK
jgi:hypothetical protein